MLHHTSRVVARGILQGVTADELRVIARARVCALSDLIRLVA